MADVPVAPAELVEPVVADVPEVAAEDAAPADVAAPAEPAGTSVPAVPVEPAAAEPAEPAQQVAAPVESPAQDPAPMAPVEPGLAHVLPVEIEAAAHAEPLAVEEAAEPAETVPSGEAVDASPVTPLAVAPEPSPEPVPVPALEPAAGAAAEPEPAPVVETDRLDEAPSGFVPVVLALGANLGDAQQTLRDAVTDLDRISGLEITEVSPLARTAAVGGPDQPDYLNAILLARTTLSPRALLRACQGVENAHGRVRAERNGPPPSPGRKASGATCAQGSRTNARSWARGCGSSRSSVISATVP